MREIIEAISLGDAVSRYGHDKLAAYTNMADPDAGYYNYSTRGYTHDLGEAHVMTVGRMRNDLRWDHDVKVFIVHEKTDAGLFTRTIVDELPIHLARDKYSKGTEFLAKIAGDDRGYFVAFSRSPSGREEWTRDIDEASVYEIGSTETKNWGLQVICCILKMVPVDMSKMTIGQRLALTLGSAKSPAPSKEITKEQVLKLAQNYMSNCSELGYFVLGGVLFTYDDTIAGELLSTEEHTVIIQVRERVLTQLTSKSKPVTPTKKLVDTLNSSTKKEDIF